MRKTILVLALLFCGALSLAAESRVTASIYVAPVTGRGSRPDDNSFFYQKLIYELTDQRVNIANTQNAAEYSLIGTVAPYLPTGKFSFHLVLRDNETGAIKVEGDLLYVTPYDAEPMLSSLVTSLIFTIPKSGSGIISVTGVTVNPRFLFLKVGDSKPLTATVEPSDATNKDVKWDSSDDTVAKVDEKTGVVTARALGVAEITAHTVDGDKTDRCIVTVEDPPTKKIEIKVNPPNLFLNVGKTYTLTATVTPSDAPNKDVTWNSSDDTVAKVEKIDEKTSVVTAVSEGQADITATLVAEGGSDTCSVTVVKPPPLLYLGLGAKWTPGFYRGKTQSNFPAGIQGGISAEFQFLDFMALETGVEVQMDAVNVTVNGKETSYSDLLIGVPLLLKLCLKPGANSMLEPYVGGYFNVFQVFKRLTPYFLTMEVGLQYSVKFGPGSVFFDAGAAMDMGYSKVQNVSYHRINGHAGLGYKFGFFQRKIK